MESCTDLHFFEGAEVGIDLVDVCVWSRGVELTFFVEAGGLSEVEDFVFEEVSSLGVHGVCMKEFVEEIFEFCVDAVLFGTLERGCEVVDDDGVGTAFCLSTFAGVVDDEGVDVGCISDEGLGPAGVGKSEGFSGQPFEIAMFAEMDDDVGREDVA
jgi:hypothetical protein